MRGSYHLPDTNRLNLMSSSPSVIDRKIAILIANEYNVELKSVEKEIKHCNWLHTEHGKYYNENRKTITKYNKKYYSGEKWEEYYRKYYKEYNKIHKEERRKYCIKNRERINKWSMEYLRNKYKTEPKERLNRSISALMRYSLKNKKEGMHWKNLVGYKLKDLMQHLEKQFTPEMNWENYGSYWVIDHKIPISVFNFDNYNQLDFGRCWILSNLRPLEKIKNLSKGNNIKKPFQPNLKM